LAFLDGLLYATHQVEGHFREVIKFTIHDHVEALDSILDIYKNTFQSGKCFCYVEWLRQEALYASCAVYHLHVFIRQFIHTKDCNNILKCRIGRKDVFHALCTCRVLIAYYFRTKDTGSRIERGNGRVDTKLGDLTYQYGSCIKVGKCCSRSRVSQVVGRYVYS